MPLLSNFLRRRRIAVASPHVRGDVLDLGCGQAAMAASVAPGQRYVGMERHPGLRSEAMRAYPQHRFLDLDLDRELLPDMEPFDTILMLAIVEHLKHPSHLLGQLPRLLAADGRVVITTPSPLGGALHALGAQVGLFYQEASEEHETMFSRATLEPLLWEAGLAIDVFAPLLLGGNQFFLCQHR